MQARLYNDLVSVERDIKATIEEKKSNVIIVLDEKNSPQIVQGIVCALKDYDNKLEQALISHAAPEQSWLLKVLAKQDAWKSVAEAFNVIAENKKQILFNANGTFSKRHIPAQMSRIGSQMQVAAGEIKNLVVTEANLQDAITLTYILLAQRVKAIEEDMDGSLKEKTAALNKYSGFNRQGAFESVYVALKTLVNNNTLLRNRIPVALVTPEAGIGQQRLAVSLVSAPEEKKAVEGESQKDKLARELSELQSQILALQQDSKLCEQSINDAKRRQSEYKNHVVFDKYETYQLERLNTIAHRVIPFNDELAEKCQLSPAEQKSWSVRSDVYYGSRLNPLSYARSLSVWSGKDDFVRLVPLVGEYIAGPSIKPEDVMQKLKLMLHGSNEKKRADEDASRRTENKVAVDLALEKLKTERQTKQLEMQRLEEQEEQKRREQLARARVNIFTFSPSSIEHKQDDRDDKSPHDRRLQKAWDTTYEVYELGNQKSGFVNYFMGVPDNRARSEYYEFAWLFYTIGFGFILIPVKNTLKLVTEALPRWLDAHCENSIEDAKAAGSSHVLAMLGHYFFMLWWGTLSFITSPIARAKALWNDGDVSVMTPLVASPVDAPLAITSSAMVTQQLVSHPTHTSPLSLVNDHKVSDEKIHHTESKHAVVDDKSVLILSKRR